MRNWHVACCLNQFSVSSHSCHCFFCIGPVFVERVWKIFCASTELCGWRFETDLCLQQTNMRLQRCAGSWDSIGFLCVGVLCGSGLYAICPLSLCSSGKHPVRRFVRVSTTGRNVVSVAQSCEAPSGYHSDVSGLSVRHRQRLMCKVTQWPSRYWADRKEGGEGI